MFSLIYTFFFNFYIDHIFQFFQWSRGVSSFPSSSVSNRSLLKYEFPCTITTSKHVIKSHLGIMIHSLVYFRKNFILQFENINPNLNKFATVWINNLIILSSGVSITAAADGEIGGCARKKKGRERSGVKLPGTIKIEI